MGLITRAVSEAEPEVGLGVLNQRQFMNIKIIEPIGRSEAAIRSRLRDLPSDVSVTAWSYRSCCCSRESVDRYCP